MSLASSSLGRPWTQSRRGRISLLSILSFLAILLSVDTRRADGFRNLGGAMKAVGGIGKNIKLGNIGSNIPGVSNKIGNVLNMAKATSRGDIHSIVRGASGMIPRHVGSKIDASRRFIAGLNGGNNIGGGTGQVDRDENPLSNVPTPAPDQSRQPYAPLPLPPFPRTSQSSISWQQPLVNHFNTPPPGFNAPQNAPSSHFPPHQGGFPHPQFRSPHVQYPIPQPGGFPPYQFSLNPGPVLQQQYPIQPSGFPHQPPSTVGHPSYPQQQQQFYYGGNKVSGSYLPTHGSIPNGVMPTDWCPCACTDKQTDDNGDDDNQDDRETYIIVKPRRRRHDSNNRPSHQFSQQTTPVSQSSPLSQVSGRSSSPAPQTKIETKVKRRHKKRDSTVRARDNLTSGIKKKSRSQLRRQRFLPRFMHGWLGKYSKPKVAGPNTTKRAMAQVNKIMDQVDLGSILQGTGLGKRFPKLGRILRRVRSSVTPVIGRLASRARKAVGRGVKKLQSGFGKIKSKINRLRKRPRNANKRTSIEGKAHGNRRHLASQSRNVIGARPKGRSHSIRACKASPINAIQDLPQDSNQEILARVSSSLSNDNDHSIIRKKSSLKRCMRLPSRVSNSHTSKKRFHHLQRQRQSLFQHPKAIPVQQYSRPRRIRRVIRDPDSGIEHVYEEEYAEAPKFKRSPRTPYNGGMRRSYRRKHRPDIDLAVDFTDDDDDEPSFSTLRSNSNLRSARNHRTDSRWVIQDYDGLN